MKYVFYMYVKMNTCIFNYGLSWQKPYKPKLPQNIEGTFSWRCMKCYSANCQFAGQLVRDLCFHIWV